MLKIHIVKPFESASDKAIIYVVEEGFGRRRCVTYNSEKKGFTLQELTIEPSGQEITPFLELPSSFFDDFVKGIVNYASENNIQTEQENALRSELEATKKHLEDLRGYFGKTLDNVLNKNG